MRDKVEIVAIVYGFLCMFGFIVGSVDALVGTYTGPTIEHKCGYHSIMSRTNMGYFIACELLEERF